MPCLIRSETSKASLHVVPGALVLHLTGEEIFGGPYLHHVPVQEERGTVRKSARLLHQVGDQDDAQFRPEVLEHVLDPHGGHWIHGDGELVQEQQVRVLGEGPGDGEPLLLAPGEEAAQRSQAVLDLVPEGGPGQAALHDVVQGRLAPDAPKTRGKSHVVIDGERQTHRKGKHDSNALSQGVDVPPVPHVLPVEDDLPLHPEVAVEVIHPVQGAKEGGLARVGRSDDPEDLVLTDLQAHVPQDRLASVSSREALDPELHRRRSGGHHFFFPLR